MTTGQRPQSGVYVYHEPGHIMDGQRVLVGKRRPWEGWKASGSTPDGKDWFDYVDAMRGDFVPIGGKR